MTAEEEREATSGGGGRAEGGNGDAVAQSKERGWDANKAVCSQLQISLSMEALSMATTMAWGSCNDACCPAAA